MSYGLALAKHILRVVHSKNRPLFCFQGVLDQSASLRDKEKGQRLEEALGCVFWSTLSPHCNTMFMPLLAPGTQSPISTSPLLEVLEQCFVSGRK